MDPDSTTLSAKVLIVIFIILTIVANAEYLLRYVRSPKVLYRPGHFGKITLALGSIFLALFPYVVWARESFENGFIMSCRTWKTSVTYNQFFFPFVFGLIIVSTGLSLYLSQRQSYTFNAQLMWLAMAVIPWVLALLIICPLAFTGTEWLFCYQENYFSRTRASLVIGIIIPAIAALLFSIFLNVATTTNSQQPITTTQSALTENMQNTDLTACTASPNTDLAMSSLETTEAVPSEETKSPLGIPDTTQSPHGFHQSQQGAPQQNPHPDPPPYTQLYPQHCPQQHPQPYPYPYPSQYPQQYPNQYSQQHPHQYPHQQFPNYPHPIAQQSVQQQPQVTLMSAGSVPQTTTPAASTHLTAQQLAMEKRGLLWASLIFFLSVLPFACFSLGYDLNEDLAYVERPDIINVVRVICAWISFLYPVLVPIVWRSQVQM